MISILFPLPLPEFLRTMTAILFAPRTSVVWVPQCPKRSSTTSQRGMWASQTKGQHHTQWCLNTVARKNECDERMCAPWHPYSEYYCQKVMWVPQLKNKTGKCTHANTSTAEVQSSVSLRRSVQMLKRVMWYPPNKNHKWRMCKYHSHMCDLGIANILERQNISRIIHFLNKSNYVYVASQKLHVKMCLWCTMLNILLFCYLCTKYLRGPYTLLTSFGLLHSVLMTQIPAPPIMWEFLCGNFPWPPSSPQLMNAESWSTTAPKSLTLSSAFLGHEVSTESQRILQDPRRIKQ